MSDLSVACGLSARAQAKCPGLASTVRYSRSGTIQKQRFGGSFISSMMTFFWVYDGELNTAGNVLTLNTEGPSMGDDGTTAKYRETIELVSHDHRVFKSSFLGEDGQWQEFLVSHYRRAR